MKASTFVKVVACVLYVGMTEHALGQTHVSDFELREFCGFKFGSPHADPNNTNRFVGAKLKEPFRMFKNVELCYTPQNELYGICLKLQDRPVVCHGILLTPLSLGATFDVTVEAIQEEHRDIVEWAESEYGIKFAKTKDLGKPARYEFANGNNRISVCRQNLFGTSELSFDVFNAPLEKKIRDAQARAAKEKKKREKELAARKNEFGRNKAEQVEFEKSVNVKTFWGFVFGESFTNQPVAFDAKTLDQIRRGKRVDYPLVKLKKPFFQFDEARLCVDRATSNLTMVSMTKFYSQVPQKDHIRLIKSGYERPGLYEKQKQIVDWFSKQYQIVFSEEKCVHAFIFRNDFTYIHIERKSYNDSIEISVSGNKIPTKRKESEVVIPASAMGTFNMIL